MATLLDCVTNPDIIAYTLPFITVVADCLRRPFRTTDATNPNDVMNPRPTAIVPGTDVFSPRR